MPKQGINSDRGLVHSSSYIYMYIMYMYLRAWVNQTVHLEREDLCKQKSQNVYIYIKKRIKISRKIVRT